MLIKNAIKVGAGATLGIVLGIYGLTGITVIDAGEVGIPVKMLGSDRGMQEYTLGAGTRWIDPIRYDVYVYDARERQHKIEDMTAGTADGQPILVDVSVALSLEPEKVPMLHFDVGNDYYNRVFFPAFRSITRNNISTEFSDAIYTGEGRVRIQNRIEKELNARFSGLGIHASVNLRDIDFLNKKFVKVLEEKAIAGQKEEINRRNAKAAEQEAIRIANIAEGQKQKTIKEAEANAEKARLAGLGERQQKEEQAKGILAVGEARAKVRRLKNEAMIGPGGDKIVALEWAKQLGPNVKVYGIPTGAPGTASIMDLNGILQGAFKTVK